MDTVATAVRDELSAACPSVREGSVSDAVVGIVPSFVAAPANTEEAAALLRVAAAHGLAVVPRGAGTGLAWGPPPGACDLVVDMRAMDQVLEHAAGDLVARVQAGATIGRLGEVLAEAGQQLALDAPAEATVGGVVASGMAGPRRFRYGAPRDLLIGVTAVRADGVVAHAGGKVVKNVAGYDLGKLLAGSAGTLGLITEATFRLHPVPEAVSWVTAEFGPAELAAACGAIAAAAGSALVPSAVELDWPASRDVSRSGPDGSSAGPDGSSAGPGGRPAGSDGSPAGSGGRPLRVGVLLEGTPSGVAERAGQMCELLASCGSSGPPVCSDTAPVRWGTLPSAAVVVRVSFWVSALATVLEAVTGAAADAGAVLDAGAALDAGVAADGGAVADGGAAGARVAISGPAGAGALYACLDPGTDDETAVRFIAALRDRLPGDGRSGAVVLAASPAVLAAAGALGTVPGLALMRAVKDQFDPDHRMFPGRMLEGA